MRYTVRQQHCLQTMGIVPWVSRFPEDAAALAAAASSAGATEPATALAADDTSVIEGAIEPASVSSAVEAPGLVNPAVDNRTETAFAANPEATPDFTSLVSPAATPSAAPSPAQPPHAVDTLGEWVLEQALVPIEFRSGLHPVLGVADAPLLIVLALDAPSQTAGSMSGDDGRLFELMLRSVSLTNRDTRRCQLGHRMNNSTVLGTDTVSQAGVGALCTASTRGVLVLMDPWVFDAGDSSLKQHQSRLPGSGIPLWRIAHPSILLEQPQLKRQAWQVLKALRAMLDGAAL